MTRDEWLKNEDPVAMLWFLTDRPMQVASGRAKNSRHPGDRKLRLFVCACVRLAWDKLTDDAECGRCMGTGCDLGPARCPDCNGAGRINRSRRAVEVAEAFADGLATEEELAYAREEAYTAHALTRNESGAPSYDAWACCAEDAALGAGRVVFGESSSSPAAQADLLRSMVGDPFEPGALPHTRRTRNTDGTVTYYGCPWLTPQVLTLAQAAYEGRLADGSLDPLTLLALADALEEAGCPQSLCRYCKNTNLIDPLNTGAPFPCKNHDMVPHPLLAALRSPGPKFRGLWPLDLLLGKE